MRNGERQTVLQKAGLYNNFVVLVFGYRKDKYFFLSGPDLIS